MKGKLLFILIIFLSLHVFAQKGSGFIALSSGLSIPIADYASGDLDKGSFTTLGMNVSVEGAWFLTKHYGVGGQFGYQLHSVNASALATAKVIADPFLSDLTIRSDPFRVLHATAGIYGRWAIGKKFSVTGKLLGGVLWAKTPYQLYKPTYFLTGPDYYEITSSRDHKFFIEPGIGIQYKIASCLALKADTELISRKMQFGFNTWNGLRYDNKQISFINTLVALVILFR